MAETSPAETAPADVAAFLEDSAEELYEQAPCGYLSALPDGTIVKVNETLLSWTGYRREELVGRRRFQELLTPGGKIWHETHYAPLLRMQASVREIAVELVCADGRRLPTLINSTRHDDEHGTPRVIRTTVFDASDRRAYERELLRQRKEAELAAAEARLLARTLQASFIPPSPPRIPGLEVAAAYRPAGQGDEVGGDFYDVFETRRQDWAITVGDVCGKGAEAAAVTALARYTIRAAAMHSPRPAAVLATLNQALIRQEAERFCTVAYARIRVQRGGVRCTVASGGHPLPILARPGQAPKTVGRAGTLLGVVPTVDIRDTAFALHAGESLVLFTDGIPEARRGVEFYGTERLVELVGAHGDGTAEVLVRAVMDDVVGFQDGLPRDDIALVVVRVPPAAVTP